MSQEIIALPAHDINRTCKCGVKNHVPMPRHLHRHHILPLSWGGRNTPENTVWLCPTSHLANVHTLLDAYLVCSGKPPWSVRQYYNRTIRMLAAEGWQLFIELPDFEERRAKLLN